MSQAIVHEGHDAAQPGLPLLRSGDILLGGSAAILGELHHGPGRGEEESDGAGQYPSLTGLHAGGTDADQHEGDGEQERQEHGHHVWSHHPPHQLPPLLVAPASLCSTR